MRQRSAGLVRTLALVATLVPTLLASTPAAQTDGRVVTTVQSRDGTPIAVECAGTGPTLLMVHGGVGDRTRWTPMIPLLAADVTACAMDRRGRGGSGDHKEYSLHKEAEDVAAVVESRPGLVFVLGHSYGAVAALEAAFLTPRVAGLILYEPPVMDPADHNLAVAAKLEEAIRAGQPEQAVVIFQTEIGQQSPAELAAMRTRPSWPGLVATVGLQPRQIRALAEYRFDASRMRRLTTPTLLLIGGETKNPHHRKGIEALRSSLPRATVTALAGQQHNAMDGARDLLADTVRRFVRGR